MPLVISTQRTMLPEMVCIAPRQYADSPSVCTQTESADNSRIFQCAVLVYIITKQLNRDKDRGRLLWHRVFSYYTSTWSSARTADTGITPPERAFPRISRSGLKHARYDEHYQKTCFFSTIITFSILKIVCFVQHSTYMFELLTSHLPSHMLTSSPCGTNRFEPVLCKNLTYCMYSTSIGLRIQWKIMEYTFLLTSSATMRTL